MNPSRILEKLYDKVNLPLSGRLDILRNALRNFTNIRGPQAAAGMAFYAFFSLFPLVLALIVIGSIFLERERVFQQVIQFLNEAIPISTNLIDLNLKRVMELRGPIGIISLVGLIWSASGMFSMLVYNINLAWPEARRRNFFEKRLIALGMIALLSVLLFVPFLIETVFKILLNLKVPWVVEFALYSRGLWTLISSLTPGLFIFFLFFALYWLVPTKTVRKRAALWSALIAALAWKLATYLFNLYLTSGLSRYDIVYGSLGAVVALIFLIYILSWITLFGANLCASINQWLNRTSVNSSRE